MIGIIGGNSTVIQNLTDQYNAIKDNPAYAQQAAQLQALIGMLQQDMNKGSASAASQYAAAGAQLVNGTSQLNRQQNSWQPAQEKLVSCKAVSAV